MCALFALLACTQSRKDELDPDNPLTVTLWSYGGEPMQQAMGPLITQFNESAGQEAGVIVEVVYYNDPGNLDNDMVDAAAKKVGAHHLPDMFCAYPNTAFRIDAITPLVDLDAYIPPSEKTQFRSPFVEYATIDGRWLLFPVAKSTEALFVNKTAWEHFAAATGYSVAELGTWEGLARTAAAYNTWTDAQTPQPDDGQAFMSIDYAYSLMLMAAEQFAYSVFNRVDGGTRFHMRRETARKLWDVYYIPHIKGYFRNDFGYTAYNMRQKLTVAGVTSTAFGGLQLDNTSENGYEAFDIMAFPYPQFAEGTPTAPLRGGQDVAVVAGDALRERACIIFLKWFTENMRNLEYTLPKGYLPVKKNALQRAHLEKTFASITSPVARKASLAALKTFETCRMYRNSPFAGDAELERVLKHHLPRQVQKDLAELAERTQRGEPRATIIAELMAEPRFEEWYADLMQSAHEVLSTYTAR